VNETRLGIAGVGLIGGSIGLRARAQHVHVAGYDADPTALQRAVERGAIDTPVDSLAALAGQCDLLIIALPVDDTAAALEESARLDGPSLVIDVASVKAPLIRAAAAIRHYVGTHPMAGRERGGIEAAAADLFERATWAHSPHTDAVLVQRTRGLIRAMGAVPLEIAPERHDAIVALTSHLPQAVSVALGALLAEAARDDGDVMELCGPGMMSMLRLAGSPESVWNPIVAANRAPLAERMRAVARMLETAACSLEAGESGALMSYFASARAAAATLEERLLPGARSSTYSRPQPPSSHSPPPAR
jgi:prephenate dehydrogenase